MNFISKVPLEHYFLVIPTGKAYVYGICIGEDIIEFLINEFGDVSFEIVPLEEVIQQSIIKESRICGNKELLYI